MSEPKIKKHAGKGAAAKASAGRVGRLLKYPCLRVMKLKELAPAGWNPRMITEERRARLAKSTDPAELGNLQPLTFNVRTKTLIGGHQRREIFLARGDTTTPVWCVDLPAEKEKAANLALNNLAGEWDEQALSLVLSELQGLNFDLELTGFDADMLAGLATAASNEGTIKTVKPLPAPTRTWFLIGMPTVKMPLLQGLIDRIAELPEAYLKSTVNDDALKAQGNGTNGRK